MTVRTSTLLVSMVLNSGVSAAELAKSSGISESTIRSPTFVSYDEGMKLWEAAERLTRDPLVGLRAGSRFCLDQLSVLGTLFGHASDLREGLDRVARLLPLIIQNVPIQFRTIDGGTSFEYRSPSTGRHGVDSMFAALVKVSRECTRHDVVPSAITFQSRAPDDIASYERFFGVRPSWGHEVSSLQFADADLALPMRGAEPAIAAILEERAPELLAGTTDRAPFALRVENAIAAGLAEGDGSLGAVARRLGVSARSLQRRLRDADSSFNKARAAAIQRRAFELLSTREDLGIEQIADMLGFANRRSFERAFRRWTGSSPAAARKGA
jgi:AraC-like DNA-binding protein